LQAELDFALLCGVTEDVLGEATCYFCLSKSLHPEQAKKGGRVLLPKRSVLGYFSKLVHLKEGARIFGPDLRAASLLIQVC